jgi:hypothetical protein
MPIPFVVEPDAFEPIGGNQPGWVAAHERLLQIWGRFGVLVLPANGAAIAALLAKLPQALRSKWQAALKSAFYRKKICQTLDSPGIFEHIDKLVTLKNDVNVACVEETTAMCFGIDHDMFSRVIDEVFEICRLEAIDQTRFFREEAELWDKMVYSGARRVDVWEKRFRPLAINARNIAIIDRYSLLHHERLFVEGGGGLRFFLRMLGQIGLEAHFSINVFASDVPDDGLDVSRAVANLQKTANAITFPIQTSLHLHVVPDQVFGKVAHDRFLRFDAVVTSIGNGLTIFERDVCDSNFYLGLQWDLQAEFRDKIEGELRGNSSYKRLL